LVDCLRYGTCARVMTRIVLLFFSFCSVLSFPCFRAAAEAQGWPRVETASLGDPVIPASPLDPVYRLPLRIHLGGSGRSPADFKVMLEEINDIWLSQAGICFEMQIVLDDDPLRQGMDIWFLPDLSGDSGLNGIYRDEHHIQVRDTPVLGPAPHPAHYPAARTAAHECGHGLSLRHRQDSDDNLMRSKTYGWQLNAREVIVARKAAVGKALQDTTPRNCGEPTISIHSGSSTN